MEKILSCLAIVIFVAASCKKADESIVDEDGYPVTGVWELRQIMGNFTRNYAPGNGTTLELTVDSYTTTDSTFAMFVYGNHHKKGGYKIVGDTTVVNNIGLLIPAGQFTNRIILDGDTTSQKVFLDVRGNTLRIAAGFFPTDGGSIITYERK